MCEIRTYRDKEWEKATYQPEYCRFHIEVIPKSPYGDTICDLLLVETNMRARRDLMQQVLTDDETVCCLSTFPTLGCGEHTYPPVPSSVTDSNGGNGGPISLSKQVSDALIFEHVRFRLRVVLRYIYKTYIRVALYKHWV